MSLFKITFDGNIDSQKNEEEIDLKVDDEVKITLITSVETNDKKFERKLPIHLKITEIKRSDDGDDEEVKIKFRYPKKVKWDEII